MVYSLPPSPFLSHPTKYTAGLALARPRKSPSRPKSPRRSPSTAPSSLPPWTPSPRLSECSSTLFYPSSRKFHSKQRNYHRKKLIFILIDVRLAQDGHRHRPPRRSRDHPPQLFRTGTGRHGQESQEVRERVHHGSHLFGSWGSGRRVSVEPGSGRMVVG